MVPGRLGSTYSTSDGPGNKCHAVPLLGEAVVATPILVLRARCKILLLL